MDTRSQPREKNSPQEDSTTMKTPTLEITKTDHKEVAEEAEVASEVVEVTTEMTETTTKVPEAASEVKEEAASEVVEAAEVADTMMIFHH